MKTKEVAAEAYRAVEYDFVVLRQRLSVWWFRKVSWALASIVGWALSRREVQQVIADAFSGQTPMCKVLREAVDDREVSVDADDIVGLSGAIDNALEHLEIDAENVNGLSKEIEAHLEELTDDLIEQVVGNIRERLRA